MEHKQVPKRAAPPASPSTLPALWKRCQAGDPAAQRALVERYQERVYRLCLRYLENDGDAWDAAQELFLRLLKSKGEFTDEARLEGWIVRVVHNLAMDHFRRRKKWFGMDEQDPASDKPGPDTGAQQGEESGQVRRVLKRLPKKYREVLALREMERLEPGEIAKMLKIPSGLVRWRAHRARLLFRKEWEHLFGKEGPG